MKKSKRKNKSYKLRLSAELVDLLKTRYAEKVKKSKKVYSRKNRKRISFEEA